MKIDSAQIWNDTGIILTRNTVYRYAAVGTWTDATIACDADGYDSPNFLLKLAEHWRRVPKARWFQLIGSIDRNPNVVVVLGASGTFVAPARADS